MIYMTRYRYLINCCHEFALFHASHQMVPLKKCFCQTFSISTANKELLALLLFHICNVQTAPTNMHASTCKEYGLTGKDINRSVDRSSSFAFCFIQRTNNRVKIKQK